MQKAKSTNRTPSSALQHQLGTELGLIFACCYKLRQSLQAISQDQLLQLSRIERSAGKIRDLRAELLTGPIEVSPIAIQSIVIKAIGLSLTIDTRGLRASLGKKFPLVSSDPLMFAVDAAARRYLMAFKYGVIVLINHCDGFEQEMIETVRPFLQEPLPAPNSDELTVVIDPSAQNQVLFDRVIVTAEDEKYWQILGMLLAQSIALDFYEKKVDQLLAEFSGRLRMSTSWLRRILFPKTSEIIANINETISLHQDIITNLEVLDKPDLTWEGMDLDKLYREFLSMVELPERIAILEQKLNLLKEHMGTALTIVSAQRMEVLEIVIILLIALSILQGLLTLR